MNSHIPTATSRPKPRRTKAERKMRGPQTNRKVITMGHAEDEMKPKPAPCRWSGVLWLLSLARAM